MRILFAMMLVIVGTIASSSEVDAQGGRGVIRGIVRDSAGAAVPFAEIALVGSESRTMADAFGRFRLTNVPFGEVELRVRRLGYRPLLSTLVFPRGATPDIELMLSAAPDYLPDVEVLGQRQVYDARLAGFRSRSTQGKGHFITRERLDRVHSYRFTDVLREIPGVRLRTLRGGGTTITLRGATCAPLVFVDGTAASAGTVDLDMFDLATVDGIEVYPGMATIPPEFVTGHGLERCGVVAIWSRPYRPKPKPIQALTARDRELDSLVSAMSIYTVDEVDTPAALIAGTASPEYPDSLRLAGVNGRVEVQLVVNVDGTLDSESVTLVSSTNPLFTDAVQQALATARFRVATLKARPVRQVLQLPFVFRLDTKASNN